MPATKSKFTPGPWTIETPLGDDIFSIVQAGRPANEWDILATVHTDAPDEGISLAVAQANARLIAAAPDLLAALEAIQVILTPNATHCHRIIDQALSKAKNES